MFELRQDISFPSLFVVTGTDTDVGKTIVSTSLVKKLGGSYWKPIQSGLLPQTDKEFALQKARISQKNVLDGIYEFKEALSPHLASEREGIEINPLMLRLPFCKNSPLVIEGVGGVYTPLSKTFFFIDLLEKWKIPVVIVSRSIIGTINHTLLTLEALRRRSIPILGVILNGPKNSDNQKSIEEMGQVEVLGQVFPIDNIETYYRSYEI